jgi:hypothetical protein
MGILLGVEALDALPVVWDEGPNKSASTVAFAEVLKEGLTSDEDVFTGNKNGDALARRMERPRSPLLRSFRWTDATSKGRPSAAASAGAVPSQD